ncbi:ribonuclease III [Porphyromonadaceae bacterium OttesenSCG-928-L07]|nr:ribonuclease III [Porphyromonadaceae bacterium OttesenSCG-928-L07]MDL2330577.1 ribonuclease III [Odoribacter sp. OttesenSCG-928-A06]
MIRQLIQSIKLYLHREDEFYGLSFSQMGFIPRNKNLYSLALLHKSASHVAKDGAVMNYERLEFLGDAVLGAIVAELAYKFFPMQDEGFLTRIRSKLVSRESLNELAIKIGLNKAVVAKSDISNNKHVYGDVFEAFIGAIYLDQGFIKTKAFIEKFIFPNYIDIKELATVDKNYKSRLIEWGQKNKRDIFFELKENMRSQKNRFWCKVLVSGEILGEGVGSSKKEAEQRAAKRVVELLTEESEGNIEL